MLGVIVTSEEEPLPKGSIRVVTDEPVCIEADAGGGPVAAVRTQLGRRPWLVPAVLLAAAAAYLIARRR